MSGIIFACLISFKPCNNLIVEREMQKTSILLLSLSPFQLEFCIINWKIHLFFFLSRDNSDCFIFKKESLLLVNIFHNITDRNYSALVQRHFLCLYFWSVNSDTSPLFKIWEKYNSSHLPWAYHRVYWVGSGAKHLGSRPGYTTISQARYLTSILTTIFTY